MTLQITPSAAARAAALGSTALLLLASGVPNARAADPFEVPWIGYNAGESAFPGNPNPMERDPYAIATADFDADGDIDVALANYDYASPGGTSGQSGFVILFNEGDGRFGEPVHYTVSTKGHFDIVAADFDEDGHPDLALPHSGRIGSEIGNTVVLYRNDGAGNFIRVADFLVEEQPLDIATGDFDADGHLDIVAGSARYSSTSIAILRGDGSGGFGPKQTIVVSSVPEIVAAGDFNGDGYDDLAVSALGDLHVVPNDGAGGFLAPVILSGPDSREPIVGVIQVVDINGDGAVDLVHGVYQSFGTGGDHVGKEFAVRLGNGNGTFMEPVYYDLIYDGTTPEALIPVDLDGDGDLDLAACDWSGRTGDGIIVIFNDGTGTFANPRLIPAGQGTQDISAADLDGDGDADIATADRMSLAVTIHFNPGDGLFPILETRFPTDTSSTLHLVVADVDADGDLDAFVSCESFGTPGALVKGNGDGTFGEPVVISHSFDYGRGVSTAKLRDLDGDGHLDLLYNDAHTDYFTGYDFWVALNDGTGNFQTPVEWDLNTCGNGDVDAFDLDEDGDLDVVNTEELACAGGTSADKLYISINNGDATFQTAYTVTIGVGPHALAGGDFNHDGDVDLVTTHWMPYGLRDFINVHIGRGDGTFNEEIVYLVGQGPRYMVVDDFNGDGHQDIATANSGADNTGRETLTVLSGTGTGTFTGRQDYYAPYAPDLLGVTGLTSGDLDEDGDQDLLMSTVANGIALYLNDGTGQFEFPHRLGVYWGASSPAFADFDADGRPDLLTLVSVPPSGLGRELALQRGLAQDTASTDDVDGMLPAWTNRGARLTVSPNPFRSLAQFSLKIAEPQKVTVALFDPLGRRVALLHAGPLSADRPHAFQVDGRDLPSGVYVIRATGESVSAVGRATIIR